MNPDSNKGGKAVKPKRSTDEQDLDRLMESTRDLKKTYRATRELSKSCADVFISTRVAKRAAVVTAIAKFVK